MIAIRPVDLTDAAALSKLYVANWSFLARWEPVRDEAFFTEDGQRARLTQARQAIDDGIGYGCVIEVDGQIAGTITLNGITRGAAQCAYLGYWVAEHANGRGVATRAVALMLGTAFGALSLHRVQAETLPDNVRSQRVLERNGFERIGFAPSFLKIAGRWQDHVLFQRLSDRD
jgi:ribosomal-protein-alanine N-acetyltransferase